MYIYNTSLSLRVNDAGLTFNNR